MPSPPVVYPDYINDSDESILGENTTTDRRGPRGRRRDKRIEDRNENPKPWRHFWLPRQAKYLDDPDKWYYYDSDDSEENTPKRKLMILRPPSPDRPDLIYKKPAPSVVALHQQRDQECHDMAAHSCTYCNKLIADLRKQAALALNRKDWEGNATNNWGGWTLREIGYTVYQALDAAADGCVFFSHIARGLNPVYGDTYLSERGHTPRFRRQPILFGFGMGGGWPTVWYWIRKGNDEVLGRFTIFTIPGENPLHEMLGYRLPVNLIPNSKLSFSRARRWLDDCRLLHSKCRDYNQPFMPKRVMEVIDAPVGFPSPFIARLVTNPKAGPYVALSYCWGGDQPAKTTLELLSDYEREIPVATLPQTIHDALIATREIGLRYLWVDAMCIVQNDAADVSEQISQMQHIYRGSFVTIAVSEAETSREGFLKPREMNRSVRMRARLDDNVFGDVLAIPFYLKSGPARLFTRAWTFQETLLSTRILCYTFRDLSYVCLQGYREDSALADFPLIPAVDDTTCMGNENEEITSSPTEVTGDPLVPPASEPAAVKGLTTDITTTPTKTTADGAVVIIRRNNSPPPLDPGNLWLGRLPHPVSWFRTMSAYTKRELTVDDDKLLAISAIAEQYSHTKPVTTYLAGMWREDFLWQCLWSTRSLFNDTLSRPTTYRAPSWSWASVNGEVSASLCGEPGASTNTSDSGHYTTMLMHVETTLYDPTLPFGRVTAGFMRIRTKMRHVVWDNVPFHPSTNGLAPGDTKARWQFYSNRDYRLTVNPDIRKAWPTGNVIFWCNEIFTYLADDGRRRGEGLLLEEVPKPLPTPIPGTGPEDSVFRRVGVIRYGSTADDPYWFDEERFEKYDWREIVII